MNKVFLVGNLTKDPELSTTTNGISVCRFSLAVSRRYVGASGERETDFINIVVWRGQAENCHKYLKKGSKCGIVGTLQTRSYDAQDGTKRYVTEVVADEVEFISTRNSDSASKQEVAEEVEDVTELKPIDDDSLPF
ncbi:MAG: single-stranded DNA-binding protein [Firmicutes bacterium]|nr:single-stranded DNA-binding protein [Bacillota bacterium]MDY3658906.1 single-stranded DNA-binding protein [Eubacteriales bacterium]